MQPSYKFFSIIPKTIINTNKGSVRNGCKMAYPFRQYIPMYIGNEGKKRRNTLNSRNLQRLFAVILSQKIKSFNEGPLSGQNPLFQNIILTFLFLLVIFSLLFHHYLYVFHFVFVYFYQMFSCLFFLRNSSKWALFIYVLYEGM